MHLSSFFHLACLLDTHDIVFKISVKEENSTLTMQRRLPGQNRYQRLRYPIRLLSISACSSVWIEKRIRILLAERNTE